MKKNPVKNSEEITPVLLTLNEEPNIERIISRLTWANEIVVVDSGSEDHTVEILNSLPNVRVIHRKFDNHASQWSFAVHETAIKTPWVLAMDADYLLSEQLVEELSTLKLGDGCDAYSAPFIYCIDGKPINGSLYHPVTVLFKKDRSHYIQNGHTQRVQIKGAVGTLQSTIFHDDRKPFKSWLGSQKKYAILEARLILGSRFKELSLPNRARKLLVITPILVPPYVLFVNGVIFNGLRGLRYAVERFIAEALISYYQVLRK